MLVTSEQKALECAETLTLDPSDRWGSIEQPQQGGHGGPWGPVGGSIGGRGSIQGRVLGQLLHLVLSLLRAGGAEWSQ